jgi:hypothetical protein
MVRGVELDPPQGLIPNVAAPEGGQHATSVSTTKAMP